MKHAFALVVYTENGVSARGVTERRSRYKIASWPLGTYDATTSYQGLASPNSSLPVPLITTRNQLHTAAQRAIASAKRSILLHGGWYTI